MVKKPTCIIFNVCFEVMDCEYLILTFDKLHLVYINIDRKVIRMTVVVLVY